MEIISDICPKQKRVIRLYASRCQPVMIPPFNNEWTTMKINNPHDFTDNADSNDDLIQTTRRIQKSCHELQQELAEITSSGHLPPVFHQGLERELDKLQGCATSFLRKHRD